VASARVAEALALFRGKEEHSELGVPPETHRAAPFARAGAKLLELKTEFVVSFFPRCTPKTVLSKDVFIRSSIHSPP
jgi:hypothetical protein